MNAFQAEGGDGERLQQKLQEYDAGTGTAQPPSYIERLWDHAYLTGRDPIAINVNYFFGFEDDPAPAKNTQVCLRPVEGVGCVVAQSDTVLQGRAKGDRV